MIRVHQRFAALGRSVLGASLLVMAMPVMATTDEDDNVEAGEAGASTNNAAEMAKKFGFRSSVLDIALSPDGTRFAILTADDSSKTRVMWGNVAGGDLQHVVSSSGRPDQLRWCEFTDSDRLLCEVYMIRTDGYDNIAFRRKIGIDLSSENVMVLGQRDSSYDARLRQSTGDIVDWLDGTGKILLAQDFVPEAGRVGSLISREKDGRGVVELDTRTNKSKIVESPNSQAERYWSDGDNGVRMIAYRIGDSTAGYLSGRYRIDYRLKGSRKWERFSEFSSEGADGANDFWPIEIDHEGNKVFGFMKKDGREALYSVSLDGNLDYKLVFEHPRVDLSGVVRFGQGGRIVGVSYHEDQPVTEYFDPGLKALAASLSAALPGLPLIHFLDSSNDEKKLLISAGSDKDPGRFYVLHKDRGELQELMVAKPLLTDVPLSDVEPVSYSVADGTNIPGYLTLPPGKTRADARNLPAIVMPHGGPASRDTWGFDWLAQFFANQGYAVLQPNFRGSAGFGDEWYLQNGYKSWETSVGDINAGGRWLVTQGIANPAKLAIVGWSYGGYAALQSTVLEPGLFKAVAAIAPVTDLDMIIRESRNFTNHRLVEEMIGSGPHVKQGSPLQRAADISAPVILFHGDQDLNVSVKHSQALAREMKKIGKSVEYHEFEELDHQLPDSSVRAKMLLQIQQFLAQKM